VDVAPSEPTAGSLRAVRKLAGMAEERARLGRECQVLRFARHPGVVELLAAEPDGDRPEALVLRAVEGGRLADAGAGAGARTGAGAGAGAGAGLSQRSLVALGAAIATILADLHDIGVVHGRVEPSHVLLEPDGRPVLCGLGHGRCPGLPEGPDPADDVAALGTMLQSLLGPAAPVPVLRVLARAGHVRPARRPTARRLACTLGHLAAGADTPGPPAPPGPPGPPAPPGPRRPSRRRGRHPLAVVGAVAVAIAIGFGFVGLPSVSLLVPATTLTSLPVVTPGGIVVTATGRYRVGGPGDQIVVGRWRCPGGAAPAVLRISTGEVWAFEGWARPAGVLDPRLVATVPGATALRVAATPSGCDRLVVVRRSGPPVTLTAGPR
jgi:hypothetical protein